MLKFYGNLHFLIRYVKYNNKIFLYISKLQGMNKTFNNILKKDLMLIHRIN